MKDAIAERAQKGIVALGREAQGGFEVAGGDGGAGFIEHIDAGPFVEAPPPESALGHDDERGHEAEKDGPHDWPAFVEEVDGNISKQRCHNYFVS